MFPGYSDIRSNKKTTLFPVKQTIEVHVVVYSRL